MKLNELISEDYNSDLRDEGKRKERFPGDNDLPLQKKMLPPCPQVLVDIFVRNGVTFLRDGAARAFNTRQANALSQAIEEIKQVAVGHEAMSATRNPGHAPTYYTNVVKYMLSDGSHAYVSEDLYTHLPIVQWYSQTYDNDVRIMDQPIDY